MREQKLIPRIDELKLAKIMKIAIDTLTPSIGDASNYFTSNPNDAIFPIHRNCALSSNFAVFSIIAFALLRGYSLPFTYGLTLLAAASGRCVGLDIAFKQLGISKHRHWKTMLRYAVFGSSVKYLQDFSSDENEFKKTRSLNDLQLESIENFHSEPHSPPSAVSFSQPPSPK